jgi:hypothetical protein
MQQFMKISVEIFNCVIADNAKFDEYNCIENASQNNIG